MIAVSNDVKEAKNMVFGCEVLSLADGGFSIRNKRMGGLAVALH